MSSQPDKSVSPIRQARRSVRYLQRRAARHLYWARTQGIGRLIEEDQLNPVDRVTTAVRNARWRRRYGGEPGTARAVFLVGVQRSGTNMLVRGLETSSEFEVHNENDRRVFERYQLRSDERVIEIVAASRHRYVLFKPLCESHRVDQLLELPLASPPLAIWAFRDPDARARSALAKFGDANLRALTAIAAGRGERMWQAQRMSASTLEVVRSFDYPQMTPATAALLFWWARNRLVFELGLDRRPDVLISSYDRLVRDPEEVTRTLCDFLGFPWRPELMRHVDARSATAPRPLPVDPRVRALCDELHQQLDAAAARGASRH